MSGGQVRQILAHLVFCCGLNLPSAVFQPRLKPPTPLPVRLFGPPLIMLGSQRTDRLLLPFRFSQIRRGRERDVGHYVVGRDGWPRNGVAAARGLGCPGRPFRDWNTARPAVEPHRHDLIVCFPKKPIQRVLPILQHRTAECQFALGLRDECAGRCHGGGLVCLLEVPQILDQTEPVLLLLSRQELELV